MARYFLILIFSLVLAGCCCCPDGGSTGNAEAIKARVQSLPATYGAAAPANMQHAAQPP
jgi:hypothetical protein